MINDLIEKIPQTWRAALMIGASIVASALFLAPPLGEISDVLSPAEAKAAAVNVAPAPAEVMHFWMSGSERDALNVMRDAYVARGAEWIDTAQSDNRTLRRTLMDRFSTSTPPTAVLWQSNVELRDLAEVGLFSRLDDIATREHWDEVLPPAVRARVQVDGHYYMAPTNIHALNWVFYSPQALRRAGVAKAPRTWPELIAAMRRVEASGQRAIAIGAGDWEAMTAFSAIMVGTIGRDDYRRLITDRDSSILGRPGAREAFEVFAEFRDIARRHRPYADWVQAAQAVARGEAAFEFMGDWAKAEMMRAGAVPGRTLGCMLAPGTENALILTIDGFAFPVAPGAARDAARVSLAATMLDPTVQRDFAARKGTLAARTDAPPLEPDVCEQQLIAGLADPDGPVEPPNQGLPSSVSGDFQIIVARYYNDRSMSPEQGLGALRLAFAR